MDALTITTIFKYIVLGFFLYQAYTLTSIIFSKRDQITIMTKNTIDVAIGRLNSPYFSYEKITADLSKYGIMYMLKDYNIEPTYFILTKLAASIAIGITGATFAPTKFDAIIYLLVGFVIGFFAPDLYMRASNSQDNEKMRDDIMSIYTILKIHAKAGVYITDSLIECQRAAAHPRLKQALNEMNNNILSGRVTLEEAVDQFNARFCNEQIDNLSIIIKQAIRTGHSADLLEDIAKQIDSNNSVRAQKKRDSLKRKNAIIQTMFFGIITAILVYLVAMEMMAGLEGL